MAAPLTDENGPFGALIVSTSRPDAWGETDGRPARGDRRPGRHHDPDDAPDRRARPLARRPRAGGPRPSRRCARSPRGSRSCASPSEILQDVVTQAGRLVRADGVDPRPARPATGNLHWALDDGLSEAFSAEERAKLWISVGVGATGIAVAEDRVIVADDDLRRALPALARSRPSSTSGPASAR